MKTIYNDSGINLFCQNTLILGATIELKKKIIKALEKSCSIINKNYHYVETTVKQVIDYYSINSDLNFKEKKISELGFNEYYYLAILIKIYQKSRVLLIDDLFGYLNERQKNDVIKLAIKHNVSLIIFDSVLYPVCLDFYVLVLYENNVAIEGDFKDVVLQEKILKRLGYELPFYVDLSIQLNLFGLLDNIYFNKKELEDNLWK